MSCDHLPPEAAASVPAPFDRYMRLMCRDPVGQGLQAVEGFRWTTSEGIPIGLSAMSAAGATGARGSRRFDTSWYTLLAPVDLAPSEQRRLKLALGRGVRPHLLDSAALLELRARTSNGEEKLILIVVPGTEPGKPDWLIGLECNGSCFRKDGAPLIFTGSAE